jgi:hypothetical protein
MARLTPEQIQARDRERVRAAHEELEAAHELPQTERVPPDGVRLS